MTLAALMAAMACALAVGACGGGGDSGGNSQATQAPAAGQLSAMAQLGEKLFNDTALSASGKQSCATCHVDSRAFAGDDRLAVPLGGPNMDLPGLRNTPALAYNQFTPAFSIGADGKAVGGFFRDGRSPSLADQAEKPFFTPFEMANATPEELLGRLLTRPYLDEFTAVFGKASVQDATAALHNIGQALAQYQKEDPAFHQFSSKYDAYLKGATALTPQELNGLALFNNPAKGNCTSCHVSTPTAATPALFTDFSYDNVGIPRNWKIPANIGGNTLDYVPKNGTALGEPNHDYYDLGLCGPLRDDLARSTSRCGAFKVPTLRNIALTGPYFHNGVFDTLQEVVAWYITRDTDPARWYTKADGSPDVSYNDLPAAYGSNVNVSEVPYIPGLAPTLTNSEMADLVHFLCTLTDGFDPANPAAYRVPAQCNATADSIAATRAGTAGK
ncbi:cytochrome-c peroxidase [Cupriavidus taiwanensis]|uniref:Di-heme cytochrome c peroxidase n=1 Tax=Cupriavidus taiwanensis TaxID=164546 RepID=A0A7Z7NR61_9BURK|nr:cytochrome c peroxidase [Cupriavidus taiwanensis]SOZ17560.1 Di-heme cytochrome c peroxidase [Cupriavidus taiwanensis]SOZ96244.1 Di-heme cytochrome c peroxidase [Cupriavidus taiwanensis]SPC25789.1 Di-heme cytochrome c peroxidase [Cupriavidus taiwanensis]